MKLVRESATHSAGDSAGQGQPAGRPRPYALLLTENKGLLAKIGQPFIAAGCDLVMARTKPEASRYLARLQPRYVVVEIGNLRSEPHQFLRSLPDRQTRTFELIVIMRHPLLRAVAEAADAEHVLTSREQSHLLSAQIRRVCLDNGRSAR